MLKAFLGCLALLTLTGCYGPVDITYHEPAHYKGHQDPLLAKQSSSEQQEVLLERFQQVQTDR